VTARVLLAASVLAVLIALFAFKVSAKMPDYEVYWRTAARAAAAEPLYRAEDEHYQLKYLPAFAIFAIPAAMLPLQVSKAVWFGVMAALLYALLALSLALLPERRKARWILVAATSIVMAKFYGHELVLGQVNLLLVTIVLLAVHACLRGWPVAAGLLVALAIVVKPYAVIFVPWFVARRDFRALAASVAGVAVVLALPSLVYGFDGAVALHRDWWRTVTESTAPNLLNADNVSVAAMYAKWMGPGRTAALLALATACALLAAAATMVLLRKRVAAPDGLEAALLLTLIPLLSPQGWDYVFLASTPAVMYLVNYERALDRPLRIATLAALAVVAFSVYDLMGRRAYGMFMALSIVTVCYLVIVSALVALRVKRVA
jgi:alpha-1,2-mannosyltransferase